MAMPTTGIAMIIEFTRIGHDMWVLVLCAMAGPMATFRACTGAASVAHHPERELAPSVVAPTFVANKGPA